MAYIPPGPNWYLADVILEIRVDGDPHLAVHVNTFLLHADSPAQAYDEALSLGRREESTYENPENRTVQITFRGLKDLTLIHEPLEHGSELCYSQHNNLSESDIQHLVTPRDQLPLFQPRQPSPGPNYMPNDIAHKLRSAGFKNES